MENGPDVRGDGDPSSSEEPPAAVLRRAIAHVESLLERIEPATAAARRSEPDLLPLDEAPALRVPDASQAQPRAVPPSGSRDGGPAAESVPPNAGDAGGEAGFGAREDAARLRAAAAAEADRALDQAYAASAELLDQSTAQAKMIVEDARRAAAEAERTATRLLVALRAAAAEIEHALGAGADVRGHAAAASSGGGAIDSGAGTAPGEPGRPRTGPAGGRHEARASADRQDGGRRRFRIFGR